MTYIFQKKNLMIIAPLLYVALLAIAINGQDLLIQPQQYTIVEVINDSSALVEDGNGDQATVYFDDRPVFDNDIEWGGFPVEVISGEWQNEDRTVLKSTLDIWG
ncbi:hypothetical protein H0266_18420 [Halobacillus locisalis]|uniref:Uncharacterized protein n=1 Tax=Halobacillus locisalis TaxID=220753 RepID=A0A838CY93_9BACI|nr:hypothetical protein [Halobacillus locisalis]MBA2176858.1 hypothetical protein [Halobacillus locisalis]